MYLPPLSGLSCHCCKPGLMACDPEGFSLLLDPVLRCLRGLCCWAQILAELRSTGSGLALLTIPSLTFDKLLLCLKHNFLI